MATLEDHEIEYFVSLRLVEVVGAFGFVKASSIGEARDRADRGEWSDDIVLDSGEIVDWIVGEVSEYR